MIRKILALFVLALVLAGPYLAHYLNGNSIVVGDSRLPFDHGAAAGILGNDHLGQSVAANVLEGGQALVVAATLAGILTTMLGMLIGCLGVLHPRIGFVIEALADAAILVPAVIVLLVATVLFPASGIWLLIGVAVLVGSPFASRVIASAAYPVAHSGYVIAARSTGSSTLSIVFRDIIPNISEVLRTVLGLRIVEALHLLAVASFLGVRSGLGENSWSAMVRDNATGISLNPASVLAPATALAITSIAVIALLRQPKESNC